MWLINAWTYRLEYYVGTKIPQYAILSHTWGEEEVSFRDMDSPDTARTKKGFWKIEKTCNQAKQDNVACVWVDTCCIDKSSSAELQESINSMYAWYRNSVVCYALLSDAEMPPKKWTWMAQRSTLGASRWFRRGWTLQELIAPNQVVFFDRHWTRIGQRHELASSLSSITKIDAALLESHKPSSEVGDYSIAQRMSWAARRKTTRVEDRAYSLLGIFNVTMPLLYGEGEASFIRLQEEILRRSTDLSIFAWNTWSHRASQPGELLASSADCFLGSGAIVGTNSTGHFTEVFDHDLTTTGIRLTIPLLSLGSDGGLAGCAALLGCRYQGDITRVLALHLRPMSTLPDNSSSSITESTKARRGPRLKVSESAGNRLIPVDVLHASESAVLETVLIATNASSKSDKSLSRSSAASSLSSPKFVWIRPPLSTQDQWWTVARYPESCWQKDTCVLELSDRALVPGSEVAVAADPRLPTWGGPRSKGLGSTGLTSTRLSGEAKRWYFGGIALAHESRALTIAICFVYRQHHRTFRFHIEIFGEDTFTSVRHKLQDDAFTPSHVLLALPFAAVLTVSLRDHQIDGDGVKVIEVSPLPVEASMSPTLYVPDMDVQAAEDLEVLVGSG